MAREENSDCFALDQCVSFRRGDIFHPGYQAVLDNLGPDFRFRGRIQYFSSAGEGQQRYAIIEAEGIKNPLIVSVVNLKPENKGQK